MAITFGTTRPKNANIAAHFVAPAATGSIAVYARYVDADNWIRATLDTTSTDSSITLEERIAGVTTVVLSLPAQALLTGGSNFIFYVSLSGTSIRAGVYAPAATGNLGTLQFQTTSAAISKIVRGLIGWEATGITTSYVRPTQLEYARYESVPFPSISPIKGASLRAAVSPGTVVSPAGVTAYGDATVTSANVGGRSATRVIRGSGASGGVRTGTFDVGSSAYATIKAAVYPVGAVRGTYHTHLETTTGEIAFSATIENLVANQWNTVRVPIVSEIIPANLRLTVHQLGTFSDEFLVENPHVLQEPISWELSADNGATWQRIVGINDIYSGVLFDAPGTYLKVRANAVTDDVRVSGYAAVPVYRP